MIIQGDVLWVGNKELEDLVHNGFANGPIEQKEFSAMTLFRDATKLVHNRAERYAKERNYDVARILDLRWNISDLHFAELKVEFYQLRGK